MTKESRLKLIVEVTMHSVDFTIGWHYVDPKGELVGNKHSRLGQQCIKFTDLPFKTQKQLRSVCLKASRDWLEGRTQEPRTNVDD